MSFDKWMKYDREQFGDPNEFRDPREVDDYAECFFNYGVKETETEIIKEEISTLEFINKICMKIKPEELQNASKKIKDSVTDIFYNSERKLEYLKERLDAEDAIGETEKKQ